MKVFATQCIDLHKINQAWLLYSARADQNATLKCVYVTVDQVGHKQEPVFSHEFSDVYME